MTADQLIQSLELQPHPEGGYYKETYQSQGFIEQSCLPLGFSGRRRFSTAIYYLLRPGEFSAFHRIRSDETWHFYLGGDLILHLLDPVRSYQRWILGSPLTENVSFQVTIPAHTWFAAELSPGSPFTLAGCTVAPGFDYLDFELASRHQLKNEFPGEVALIDRLCRS